MKHLTKFLSMAILLSATLFLFSCGEDDEPVIDVVEGIAVADGYYFVQAGEEPVAEKALLPEKVEGEGFAAVDRDGFFGNYVFLQAGEYQLQKVEAREITSTIGGNLGAPELETEEGYLVAQTEEDGPTIDVETSGYYKVSYDETETELIMMRVTTVSLIGGAVPNGSPDVDLTVKEDASDAGFVFEGSGIEMRGGNFKIRINNRWTIDRRLVRDATPAGPTNGYVAFTNYGGTTDNLVPGGADMAIDPANEGVYSVEVTLTNDGGASFTSTKTGEVEPLTFDPAEYQFGILGSVTANGFDADRDMFYKGIVDGAHTWYGVVYFAETSSDDGARRFKLRTNDDWAFNLGGALLADDTPVALFANGADIEAPAAGAYYITLSTSDEGDTWTAKMKDFGWALIGEGSPTASWEQDVEMTANGFSEGTTTYSYTGNFDGRGFKFRAGGEWQFDLGGAIPDLTIGGGDLSVEAGDYEVVLSFDGTSYSAVFTAQ